MLLSASTRFRSYRYHNIMIMQDTFVNKLTAVKYEIMLGS